MPEFAINLEIVPQLCAQAIVIDAESIFAVPSCRLLIRGANTAKTHASRPVLAEQVFASHFRIDTKAIHGVEIIVSAGVAKAQHHIPDEALIRLVGHFKTCTHEIVHDHIVGVVAEASRDSHLGSAAHSIDGEAHIKRTAVGVRLLPQIPQMGVFQGNVEAGWRSVQAFTVSRKNFVAEP